MSPDIPLTFQPLTGSYEPSGIQQLPDGRFLVVEDEKQHALSLLVIHASGSVSRTPLLIEDAGWKLDDLEGVALDQLGFIYALTSHSRDDDGDEKKSRDKLVRFRVEGDRVLAPKVVSGLKRALTEKHPVLAVAARIQDVKTGGGLNIEALEISPDQQRLLIGFRSPLQGHRALVASVENPSGIFDADEAPRISASLTALDLGGNGIRGMSFIPSLGGYLIISGPSTREPQHFELWFWSGQADASARRVTVAGIPGFERAEGVSPAVIDGAQRIIIVSDDGSREEGRFARYLLLDPEQLQIAP